MLTDVKFDERRRGYDPEQVDNFLERVSGAVAQLQDKLREATSRAEEADAKIAEAKRAQAVAEAQVDKLKADLERTQAIPAVATEVSDDPAVVAEEATNVLLMAQKAADATTADAKQQAMTTISDARTKAASIVAEAESQAERTLAEAKRQSSELLDAQSAAILEEARSLEETRDQLAADVSLLQEHFEAQRGVLRGYVENLLGVLDDQTQDAEAKTNLPNLSGASVAGLVSASVEASADEDDQADKQEVIANSGGRATDSVDSTESDSSSTSDADALDANALDDGDEAPHETPEPASADLSLSTQVDSADVDDHGDANGFIIDDDNVDEGSVDEGSVDNESGESKGEPVAAINDLGAVEDSPRSSTGSFTANLIQHGSEPTRTSQLTAEPRDLDLTTERLFGGVDEVEKPSAKVGSQDPLATDLFAEANTNRAAKISEPSLGKPDARADEAMRAFFEADFDKLDRPDNRSRFGRRR